MNSDRYSRQILFEGIGKDGQRRLLESRVLVLGCGALGASHSEMLSRAGVGSLKIVDRDFVEFSNLQRQTLFTESDAEARMPKAVAAANRLTKVNSGIDVEPIVADVNFSNIEELISDVDLVVDGSDNFQVRYLTNDACVKHEKPWIYGAAVSSYGTSMTIRPGETPCLRCIFGEMPPAGSAPTCDTAGVIQPIIASVSSVQVTEAIKILTGQTDLLHGSLLQIDIWRGDWRKIKMKDPDPDCVCCGKRKFEFLSEENQETLTSLCGRNAVQIMPAAGTVLDFDKLAESLGKSLEVEKNDYLVRFGVDGKSVTLFKDARAIIQGTDDVSEARAIYSKYVGN
ncbi:MAG: thiazole biosynthesis adenylyltransferase ThiF [Acidobacteria bacterium]|nr:MAG: thiazole biosynthesis adenylyltransferase ThiF [Acidobacteriota bacterium]REK02196.1 MAG: thiazole biosynthesis adenylyltransferase ThiF [Acidobacteriota bacterium]REK14001.1 MAG: thiazole biosynthesis adenylyltransferase ThiF [Acidobacteriota bacterium]REK41996.1 MAG: thiazole biosynthesis adenylyltransferase ThiF [Acidobacteriota bacterium]